VLYAHILKNPNGREFPQHACGGLQRRNEQISQPAPFLFFAA